MKRFPLILGLIFISVTVHRVASFGGGGFNAWAIALASACGVFLSAYFAELKTTRWPAFLALVSFIAIDGFLNLNEVLKWSVETGRWGFALEFTPENKVYIYRLTDPLYGVFPTLAAAMLGWLSKSAEKLIVNRKGNWKDRLINGFVNWLLEGSESLPEIAGTLPEKPIRESKTLPSWLPTIPKNKEHFRQLYQDGTIQLPPDITSAELAEYLPVGERSVRNWIVYAKNGRVR